MVYPKIVCLSICCSYNFVTSCMPSNFNEKKHFCHGSEIDYVVELTKCLQNTVMDYEKT
jgi:hypothetical protein